MEHLINDLRGQAYALVEDKKYRGRITVKDEKENEFTFCFLSTNGHFFTERRFYVDERDNAFGSYKLFCQAPWVGEAVIVDKLTQYRLKEWDTLLSILESDDEFFTALMLEMRSKHRFTIPVLRSTTSLKSNQALKPTSSVV